MKYVIHFETGATDKYLFLFILWPYIFSIQSKYYSNFYKTFRKSIKYLLKCNYLPQFVIIAKKGGKVDSLKFMRRYELHIAKVGQIRYYVSQLSQLVGMKEIIINKKKSYSFPRLSQAFYSIFECHNQMPS